LVKTRIKMDLNSLKTLINTEKIKKIIETYNDSYKVPIAIIDKKNYNAKIS
jgi:HSP90 family molecular chaperone